MVTSGSEAATHGTMASTLLTRQARQRIFSYLGALVVLIAFGSPSGGLIDIPISFILKNKLHLEAHEVAHFRLVTAIPLYFAFLFGFARDVWSPFGMNDRGHMLLFGSITSVLYIFFAFTPFTYATLLIAVTVLTASFLFVSAAQNGLASTLGQQHVMSGQISAVWNIAASVPTIAALLIGGAMSEVLEGRDADDAVRLLFLVGAAVMAAIALYAFWRPADVFDQIDSQFEQIERKHADGWHFVQDIGRLLHHRPLYPVMLIWLLWNFAPGTATPLQYHLQNALHASDAHWGQWNAIFAASFIPTFVLFGVLSPKLPLRQLLWWGTVVAVPQIVPLLFIHTTAGALIAAVPIGLMGGVATAAYMDLIIRACPKGLEGTTMMMSGGLVIIASRFGDVLGTYLYDHFGGFSVCVIATTAVYLLIFPVLLFVPARLTATRDGQIDAQSAAS